MKPRTRPRHIGNREIGALSHVQDHASRELKTVPGRATLAEAGKLMARLNVGSLLVMARGTIVGIVTDTDLARKGAGQGLDPATASVRAIMSSPVMAIDGRRSVEEAQVFMRSRGVRHLGVMDRGKIVGMFTLSDLVRYLSAFATLVPARSAPVTARRPRRRSSDTSSRRS